MPPPERGSLRAGLASALAAGNGGRLIGSGTAVGMADFVHGSALGARLARLSGRSVLVKTQDQLATALTLVALDGVAKRILLCPPDVKDEHLPLLGREAEIEAFVHDAGAAKPAELAGLEEFEVGLEALPHALPLANCQTEWVLMTSGTSGPPKLVVHSLASLAGAIGPALPGAPMVWGTFYDIRRYGGLQILLRAVLGARMFVLRDFDRPLAEYLLRLKQHRATHILGTPSHWRQALQLPESGGLSPTYLRLSGEICDQAILDRLRHAFPQSQVTHAYASTEAGVGFEVGDGRDGFPAALVGSTSAGVELRVIDGSLRIRSDRVAQGYLPQGAQALRDADGFFDSGDMLELSGDRYHFVGRRNGVINVGGLKVHPEEVEAVLNRHPEVQVSLVRARKSPVLGQLVVADVVPRRAACEELRESILATCRDMLPRHKVPVALRFVPSLDLSAGGKLARRDA